ncbi:hypothetical protein Pmani_009772 [Petrolisthes manimaculis]|uniref:Uncharacterized protein n=1 Tax=Petrolisthes manimaculis TaxID=1843537 RepID=A0AAE1Q1K8_9EUCA|nr:hypothetical protein Pmani_022866 [Petrolisthes manimaculis]KAK4307285.1 hypothetical protein Pmani_020947 [Petrolisthes manimaculis]KAK4313327.1 hypothetical protein Pmani_015315 [Petrolisthes manimaculis]KAK4314405.1 hypothetical protein Pmani_014292 [Petrolisthes manimaculis]KAK4317774.1 hypothetical protein Pmani_011172 [Petrolisthes manimaculis]
MVPWGSVWQYHVHTRSVRDSPSGTRGIRADKRSRKRLLQDTELFIRSLMSKENRFSVPEVFSNSLKNCKDSETLS